jgi:cell division protein FtsQ
VTTMDTRVAERRKGVFEDKARRRLRWILVILIVVLLAAGSFWLIRSPALSIRTVEVAGATYSDPDAVVASLGMGVGRPTIDVDGSAIEAAVERDPWVADATVSVIWPGSVVVDVIEYEPLVAVQTGDGWTVASVEGALLVPGEPPGPADAAIVIDVGDLAIGDVTTDPMVLGALAFIDATAADLRTGLVMSVDGDGLVAIVAGHRVVLGRPVDMHAKAAVLEGLLGAGIDEGADVNLIAPSRPAIRLPDPEVSTSG